MKPAGMLGLLLVVVGVLALIFHSFSFTKREKVVDAGPIQITADKEHWYAIPPVVAFVILGAGVVLVAVGRK